MKTLSAIVISFFLAQSVNSHELPLDILYPNSTFGVAISYSISGTDISDIFDSNSKYFDFASWMADKSGSKGTSTNVCSGITEAKTCGQVDHFYQAAMVAISSCNDYAAHHKSTYPNGLVPRFTAPATFVTGLQATSGHHNNYDLSQGITFDCVYPIYKTVYSVTK